MTERVVAYRLVADELRAAIRRREFDEATALPTDAEVAERYGISRQTARRAFQDLVSDGLVYRVPGRGTFVNPDNRQYLRHLGSVEDLLALSKDTELEVIDPLARIVHLDIASRLRLDEDVVLSTRFRRIHHGDVFCVTDVFIPPRLAPLLADAADHWRRGATSATTMIGLLDQGLDQPISEAEQSVTALPAQARMAEMLEVPAGTPLLRIDRMYFSGGAPVELAISHFRPDRFSYRLLLKRSSR